jgi:hypothetical protein
VGKKNIFRGFFGCFFVFLGGFLGGFFIANPDQIRGTNPDPFINKHKKMTKFKSFRDSKWIPGGSKD